MTKPDILQLGTYPPWDQEPLEAAFAVHRLDLAVDRDAFLAEVGPHIRAINLAGRLE